MPSRYEQYTPLELIYRDNDIADWMARKDNQRTKRTVEEAFGKKNTPIYGNEWCDPEDHTGSYLTLGERRREYMRKGAVEEILPRDSYPKSQKKKQNEKRRWLHSRTKFCMTRTPRYSYAMNKSYKMYKLIEKKG